MTREIMVFDTETTHADPEEARIVSAYLGRLAADGSVVVEKEWIVRPDGFEIPAEATAIHGITTEQALAEGAPLVQVLNLIGFALTEVCQREGLPLVGQNIGYDLTVLDREVARVIPGNNVGHVLDGINVIDTYVLDKELFRYRKGSGSRKLINLAKAYDVHLTEEEAHGARADAIAAGRIAQVQLRHPKIAAYPLPALHLAQIGWRAQQCADLEKWFRSAKAGDRRDPNMVIPPEWPVLPRRAAA